MLKFIITIATCLSLFAPGLASAASYYVRPDAAGRADGSDWTNAYTTLPAKLVRGSVYYLADGTYGNYKFDTPASGSLAIALRKATAADHGTSTGWDPAYGDGEALFTGTSPVWQFNYGYIEIDGVTGQGKATTPYGIRLMPSSTKCVNEFKSAIMYGEGSYITNLSLKHLDVSWNNGSAACTAAVPALLYTASAASDLVNIEDSFFHHAPGYAFYIGGYDPNPGGLLQNRYTIKNNYFYMMGGGGGADHHWELMWLMNVDNSQIYNNVIEDVIASEGQTGWIMLAKANSLSIFGNTFFCTDPSCIVGGNGVIATWSLDAYRNDDVKIYNNTFAKLKGVFNDFGIRFTHNSVSDTNIVVKNNLYCNARFSWTGVTTQANEACGCGQVCSGTNSQSNLPSSIFVNYGSSDLRLSKPTMGGDGSLTGSVSVDMNGRRRGADGVWDRGAFEYDGSVTALPPTNFKVE